MTIADFVCMQRKKYKLTQHDLAVTLPLQSQKFHDRVLFPFFDGLIPEGWLLEIATDNWKLDRNDKMDLLLACCRDCMEVASVQEVKHANYSLPLLWKSHRRSKLILSQNRINQNSAIKKRI